MFVSRLEVIKYFNDYNAFQVRELIPYKKIGKAGKFRFVYKVIDQFFGVHFLSVYQETGEIQFHND